MNDARSDPIVGIDLGTTNSLVAFCDARGPRVLVDRAGRALLPSVVSYASAAVRVGVDALESGDESAVVSVKRLMGRGPEDLGPARALLPYAVEASERGMAMVRTAAGLRTPQEVSAEILAHLRRQAEDALGTPVRRAVITVPAYFDDAQRQATRDAGRMAGLDVERIVNEPTAAALAYGLGTAVGGSSLRAETIVVYDLGGGTFDVSVLRVIPSGGASGGDSFFQVLSTAGDTQLGGDDCDRALLALVASLRPDLREALDHVPAARRRRAAERTKTALSAGDAAPFEPGDGIGEVRVTRAMFEEAIAPLIERTIALTRGAMRDAGLSPEAIDRVVLVGGSTRMPIVRRRVADLFGREPYTALDPDQVVALGASVQAAILSGAYRELLLLDVIPLSLGIETQGGAVAKLIVRNTTVPARATEMFSTSVDGQTSVKIHVLQGERELVGDCRSLGVFHLRGLPPMPAGIPQIEVEFLVDASGVLSVTAVERRSMRRAHVQMTPRYGLTREEVDAMEHASIEHARADMHAHRVIDLAVNARLDVKWISDALSRVRDELSAEYVAEIEAAVDRLNAFLRQAEMARDSVDAEAFHQAKEALDRASMRLHEVAIARSLRGTE